MVADDDTGQPVSLGREEEMDGGYERKKRRQSRYKKYNQHKMHKKYIIFHIKN